MKNRILVVVIALLVLGAGGLILMRGRGDASSHDNPASTVSTPAPAQSVSRHDHTAQVPAYQNASQLNELAPTLPPAQFVGKARTAYQVAKEFHKRWPSCRVTANVIRPLDTKACRAALLTITHHSVLFVSMKRCWLKSYKRKIS